LVRSVLPATVTIALGIGALFSLGIKYVRDVLDATDAQFAVLVALFGVGAALGLLLLRVVTGGAADLGTVKLGVATQGATIALMSLAPTIVVAFLGAVAFGG